MQSYCFIFFITLFTIWNYLPYLFTCLLPLSHTRKNGSCRKCGLIDLIHHRITSAYHRAEAIWSVQYTSSWPGWLECEGMDYKFCGWGRKTSYLILRKHGSQCWPLCSVWYCPTPASPAWVPVLPLLEYLPLSHWLHEGRNQVSLTYLYVPGAEGIWWPAEWVSECVLASFSTSAWEHTICWCFTSSNRKKHNDWLLSVF